MCRLRESINTMMIDCQHLRNLAQIFNNGFRNFGTQRLVGITANIGNKVPVILKSFLKFSYFMLTQLFYVIAYFRRSISRKQRIGSWQCIRDTGNVGIYRACIFILVV